jgi:hypothetical protein
MLRATASLLVSGWLLIVAAAAPAPTFTREVAPILYAKCARCHRSGEAAPMALITYDDVRPWARAIKTRVVRREMPPWFADPAFSRALKDDPSLAQSEIDTIAAWADAGAPRGPGEPPPPPRFADGWRTFGNRPPDAIVEMPANVDVPAQGVVPIFTLWTPNPFTEDKFVEAVELRPGATAAVHHSDVTARSLPSGTTLGRGRAWKDGPVVSFVPMYADGRSYNELEADANASGEQSRAIRDQTFRTDDYRLLFYVPGGGFQQFPRGAVKRISAGNALAWNLHYTPTGRSESDRHRLALWFASSPPEHEVLTKRIGEAHIIEGSEFVAEPNHEDLPKIPPRAGDWRITAITPFQEPVTIYGLWPHMHLRGKDTTFIATYPDGREEVLLRVPKYDFRWQLQYEFVEPLHLPAGSTIKAIGHYDNSAANRYNPNPNIAVGWSEQTWDEMFNGWMELSFDNDVITRPTTYAIATPRHARTSLAIGAGPAGEVQVRDRDGRLVASGSIGPTPSFIEPWTFAPGQTIETRRAGADAGAVTVTLFDVPDDVTAIASIGGAETRIQIAQPGQNARVTFTAADARVVVVRAIDNTIGAVDVKVVSPDGVTIASTRSAEARFEFSVALPSSGTYVVVVDPVSANTGRLRLTLG